MSEARSNSDPRSRIPGLDRLLEAAGEQIARYGRNEVAQVLRMVLEEGREEVASGRGPLAEDPSAPEGWLKRADGRLAQRERPSIRPVLNTTGVVLHTNLGRARLAPVAVEAAAAVSASASNLEFDLEEGTRGSRYDHARDLLVELTGAEDAVVVNNCAAGLLLVLSAVARDRGVVVSRGELVEIGGGFRIPEVLERAGCELHEVGTTNRTRPVDYASAAESVTVGALLKVHRSNFVLSGFTESCSVADLVEVAAPHRLPVVHDLGSGLLIAPERLGLPPEPTPRESIEEGAHAVVFSGDKLLGGPQAGLVVGTAAVIGRMRRDPLCRALRVDKATLAALEATLRLYRDEDRALREIPTLRAIGRSREELRTRSRAAAERLRERLGHRAEVTVLDAEGRVGGGTFPEHALPSSVIAISPHAGGQGVEDWARAARTSSAGRPVVGRIEDGRWLLDLRCVEPSEEDELLDTVVSSALGASS